MLELDSFGQIIIIIKEWLTSSSSKFRLLLLLSTRVNNNGRGKEEAESAGEMAKATDGWAATEDRVSLRQSHGYSRRIASKQRERLLFSFPLLLMMMKRLRRRRRMDVLFCFSFVYGFLLLMFLSSDTGSLHSRREKTRRRFGWILICLWWVFSLSIMLPILGRGRGRLISREEEEEEEGRIKSGLTWLIKKISPRGSQRS